MLAPYATRPVVRIDGLPESGVVKGSTPIRVSASDAMFRGIGSLKIYVNGNLLAQSQGEPIELCAAFPGLTEVEILVVAQVFGVGERYDQYLPKGWNSVVTQVQPGPDDCPEEVTDAGVVDSMVPKDAGQPSPIRIDAGLVSDSADSEGCTCRTSTVDGVGPMLFPFFWVCFFFLRRRSS